MARTPVFSQLTTLVSRIRATHALGLPPSAVGEVAEFSRRRLLRAAVAGGTLAAAGCSGLALRRAHGNANVAVVGGGLAGLVAARRLRQQGLDPVVFEASSRAGGRVVTDRTSFAAGQRVERGGELIDSEHERYRRLIQELGFALDDLLEAEPAGTDALYRFMNEPYTIEQVTEDFGVLYPILQQDVDRPAAELDHISIEEWIETRVPGGTSARLGQLLTVAYDIEYGASTGEQSALNLVYLLGEGSQPDDFHLFGTSDERSRVRGGNDQVTTRLAELLGDSVRLQHRLVAARTLADGRVRLVLDTPEGTLESTFDRVVLSVPFAVLRHSVDLSGLALSPLRRAAIAELGMGTNVKLHVQFAQRHWYGLACNGETFADTGYQSTWEETRAQPGTAGILVDYLGSKGPSLESVEAATAARAFLARIEPVLPGLTGHWGGLASVDYWPGSPHQRGSYAYWRVGQYTKFAGVERAIEGNVFFAGEHTAIDFQGFMEGAVESGERAADEVLDSL